MKKGQSTMVLMSDFYKQSHAEQYPKGITKLISYATARMSRISDEQCGDKLTVFGIQAYVQDFLIERFNETFFNVDIEDAIAFYIEVMQETFPLQYVDVEKFRKLHALGYLPVEISCLPEGTRVPIRSAFELPEGQCQVPFMSIVNTHPDFPWITEFLESVTSSEIWYPMCIANQAYYYRQIVNKWYNVTGCPEGTSKSAISEFGFRGGEGSSAATLASAAFLTSFNKTATIPAIKYLHDYYGDPYKEIGGGMISTEHSVMCSNYANDFEKLKAKAIKVKAGEELRAIVGDLFITDDEPNTIKVLKSNTGECEYLVYSDQGGTVKTGIGEQEYAVVNVEGVFLHRLFTEVYPAGALSVVMDSYDYWRNLQECGAGKLREAVLSRDGAVFFRGDSGDPVDIICGEYVAKYKSLEARKRTRTIGDTTIFAEDEQCYYRYESSGDWVRYDKKPAEIMGTVELLWEMFGGTVNEAGYKVLDSHVRAIYGDSITPLRAEAIYKQLALKGFAACNVALGAGSFSTQCGETPDGRLAPFTRDTYGIAVKATWCMDKDGNERQLFKNPKTDTGKFKKSQKGLIWVGKDVNGEIIAKDGYTLETMPSDNMLQVVYRNGKMVKQESLAEVRNRLHNNKF